MYDDLLNSSCIVYRLSGFNDYDFSVSSEGEVSEAWVEQATRLNCRVDRRITRSGRRADGFVETGNTMLFVTKDADLVEGDRVYVDGKYYSVSDVTTVYGMKDPHHKEALIELIDWAEVS